MSKTTLLWRVACSLTLLVMLAGGLSCAVQPETRPRAWIDVPKDGAEVGVNTPVAVTSHVYAQGGVAEITLSVNGEVHVREAPSRPGATYAEMTQEWLPQAAGEYVLQVRAYDAEGEVSNPASIRVVVLGGASLVITTTPAGTETATPLMEPTEAPAGTATQAPTGTVAPTSTGTAVPASTSTATSTPTFTPSPTATATGMPASTSTPIPPAEVSFTVEQDSITSGECTVLHWEVENATAVELDGDGVAAQGTRQVCPTSTTTYHLHVVAPSGDVDREVTVTVTAPPDTTPPSISNITESADLIRPPDGNPNSVTISATVTDPSGVPKVDLYFRVEGGAWVWTSMIPAGGNVYQATLGHDNLKASLSPYEDADTLEYYIKARDGKANVAQSAIRTIGVVWTVF